MEGASFVPADRREWQAPGGVAVIVGAKRGRMRGATNKSSIISVIARLQCVPGGPYARTHFSRVLRLGHLLRLFLLL